MDFQNYIGYPLEVVEQELKNRNINYKVVESSEIQKKFDTILVVKISQKEEYVEIVTDRFLLNI